MKHEALSDLDKQCSLEIIFEKSGCVERLAQSIGLVWGDIKPDTFQEMINELIERSEELSNLIDHRVRLEDGTYAAMLNNTNDADEHISLSASEGNH